MRWSIVETLDMNGHACGCSHVNKKALDQYTNFTEQREELARRQTENGRAEDKIKQLIQTLDMRKDEAIERTFKVVLISIQNGPVLEKEQISCLHGRLAMLSAVHTPTNANSTFVATHLQDSV